PGGGVVPGGLPHQAEGREGGCGRCVGERSRGERHRHVAMDVGVTRPEAAEGTGPARVSLRQGGRFAFLVFLVAVLTVSLLRVVGVHEHQLTGRRPDLIIAPTPGWHNAVDGTFRWDAPWFREVATQGYRLDDESAAFFPVYPLSIRSLSAV